MPVTLGGLSSGLDTEGIIQKLLKVEARPIIQWEEDKATSNQKKQALGSLKTYLSSLQKSAEALYGFRASYHDKKAISSQSDVLEASANKHADLGNRKIEVLETASNHKIATSPIDKTKKLSSGKLRIEINGETQTINFRGGNINALHDKINEDASELLLTSLVNTSGNNYVLTLESKVPGKKGEINISGDKKFLEEIGLVKGEKESSRDNVNITFDKKYFTSYLGDKKIPEQNGNLQVVKKGKALKVKGVLWREYVIPVSVPVAEDTVLRMLIDYKGTATADSKSFPRSLKIGPEEKVNIKGIILEGYNISRTRPGEEIKKVEVIDVLGIGVTAKDNDKRSEKIYPIDKKSKGKFEIPIGKDLKGKNIDKIIFYCNEGEADFADVRFSTPVKGKGFLEPQNEISKARNARLKVDGVEIERDRNDNLNDVIKGVNLTLRGKSRGPVTLKVEPDIDKSIEKIKEFVENYNKYIEFNRSITKAKMTDKAGDYREMKRESGLFVGDMSVLRLENTLRTLVGNAYPNRTEIPIKVFDQMGISSGSINAAWDTIKEGKLIIDEVKLKKTIMENPDGIKEFFGSDNDGDNRIDHGLAYYIDTTLKAYTGAGKNIIQSKIDMEDSNIKLANERIDRHKIHLKKYEEKLRYKFSSMERSLSGAKSQRQWLENQLKGLPDGDKNNK